MSYAQAQYAVEGVMNNTRDSGQTGLPICDATFNVVSGNISLKVYFEINDLIVDGELLSKFQKATLCYKENEAPKTPDDGILVGVYGREDMHKYATTPIVIEDVDVGKTYAVRLFPESDRGVVSYNYQLYVKEVTVIGSPIFGFHQDFTNLDPDTSITYIGHNKDYQPMNTNIDTGEFTMGSWGSWDWLDRNRPYKLNKKLEVEYELNPNDYTKKIDGTDSEFGTFPEGGFYAWLPKIYIHEVYSEDKTSRDVYFCERNDLDETKDFKNHVFINKQNEELMGIWYPMMCLKYVDNGPFNLTCSSDFSYTSRTNYAQTWQLNYYSHSGDDQPYWEYYPVDLLVSGNPFFDDSVTKVGNSANPRVTQTSMLELNCLIRDLLYLLGRNADVQKVFGYGLCQGGSKQVTTHFYPPIPSRYDITKNGAFYGCGPTSPCLGKIFHSIIIGSWLGISGQSAGAGGNSVGYTGNYYWDSAGQGTHKAHGLILHGSTGLYGFHNQKNYSVTLLDDSVDSTEYNNSMRYVSGLVQLTDGISVPNLAKNLYENKEASDSTGLCDRVPALSIQGVGASSVNSTIMYIWGMDRTQNGSINDYYANKNFGPNGCGWGEVNSVSGGSTYCVSKYYFICAPLPNWTPYDEEETA